jgi:hypothetical protein
MVKEMMRTKNNYIVVCDREEVGKFRYATTARLFISKNNKKFLYKLRLFKIPVLERIKKIEDEECLKDK